MLQVGMRCGPYRFRLRLLHVDGSMVGRPIPPAQPFAGVGYELWLVLGPLYLIPDLEFCVYSTREDGFFNPEIEITKETVGAFWCTSDGFSARLKAQKGSCILL
jgi:hypothetical protein